MRISPHLRKRHGRQDGYVLLAIMVMMILALIALTATAPYYVTQVKRDREEQLIRRGKAYSNAIKRYYKRFGRYPTSLTELQSTQNLRFIRKLYKDPMVQDGEWRIIHYGEAKYPPKGFGFNNIPGLTFPGGGGSPGGSTGAQVPGGLTTIFSSSSSPGSPQPGPGGQQQTSSNQPNTSGMTPADQISKPLGTGTTLGGGPVIGVASKDPDVGIHEVNERQKISEWEFFYDPRYDVATMMQTIMPGGQQNPLGGQQPGGFGQQPGGQQTGGGFGQGPGGKR